MSAAPGPRTRLGALLLRKGLVSPVELEDALETQRTKGGLLGEILVRSGLASRPAIEDALAEQVGNRIEFEAGFGTGLRSQIASRRPRRGGPVARPHAPTPIKAVAAAPAPLLEVVPDEPEPEEPHDGAVVHELPVERHHEPDLAAELMEQVERWQRLADELREERDAVRHVVAARDRALAEAYAQIEDAAERLAASERARSDAEESRAEVEELRGRLDAERAQREQAEDEAGALRTDLVESEVELRRAQDELEEARREPAPVLATAHVVFVRTGARYTLVAADGPPPAPGARLELEGRDYLVLKVGRSPFAGDDRPCAFVEPA